MNKWRYGDSWEKFPIVDGEIWHSLQTSSFIQVCSIMNSIPFFMHGCEMIYCDPPWSKGNYNSFITKAGFKDYINSFDRFRIRLYEAIAEINPRVCYLEIGKQHSRDFIRDMKTLYSNVQVYPITYYKKHKCYLIRGANTKLSFDFSGCDDTETPFLAIQKESPATAGDLCTGRGLTLIAAHKNNIPFFGTELNKRRFAVAIERASKIGVNYEKYNI